MAQSFQTVYIGYQQATKVAARVKRINIEEESNTYI